VRLIHGLGKRGLKKPGWPATLVTKQLWALRALRKISPSGVNGQILRSVIKSQKVCSWRSRCLGGLPAMIAELMAPIDTPEIQSGSHPLRASPDKRPPDRRRARRRPAAPARYGRNVPAASPRTGGRDATDDRSGGCGHRALGVLELAAQGAGFHLCQSE
jgi:hypothetical protein